jgi:hypothetical protein
LVLSEIQRRTANEKAYAAARPQPTTTVAEEVVGEFIQPMSLQAGMPSESAPTDVFSSESMSVPASAPMQQPMMGMVGGGKTNFSSPEAVMSQTAQELKRLREARKEYQINDYGRITQLYIDGLIDEDQRNKMYRMRNDRFLEDQERGRFKPFYGFKTKSLPNTKEGLQSAMEQSRNEMRQKQLGLANGGLTSYAQGGRARASINRSFDTPFLDSIKDRYYDEEGDFNYLTALGDASLLIPIGGAANIAGRVGLAGLRKFAPGVLQKTKGLFTSPNPAISGLRRGQRRVKTDKGFDTIDTATGKKIPAQLFDPVKSVKTLSYPAAATTLISRSIDDEEIKTDNQETETEKQLRLQREAYEKQLAELRNKATAQTEPKKEIDYDLVGLGGLIMGAKNISELGAGLAGLAESKQARKDALLEGQAQQDYYRASAEKVRAEIEGLPLENKLDALEKVNDVLTKSLEGEIELTEEQLQYYNAASQTLTSQILALQGITNNLLTGPDPLEAARIQ